jgi:hypothetical protein
MADEEPVEIATEVYKVQIQVNGRIVHTTVTAIPDHSRGKTLLGMDFIKAADVILDFPRIQWRFRGQSNRARLVVKRKCPWRQALSNSSNCEMTRVPSWTKFRKTNLFDCSIHTKKCSRRAMNSHHTRNTLTDDRSIGITRYRMSLQRQAVLKEEIQRVVGESVIEDLRYTLKTGASSHTLRACLMQGEGPDKRPVECANRLLTPTEKNYTTEKKDSVTYVVTAVDNPERLLGKYHVSHLFEDEVAPGKRNPKFDDRPQDEVTSNEGAFRTGPALEKTKDEDCRHWKKEDLLVLRISQVYPV